MLKKIKNGIGWLFLAIALLLLGKKKKPQSRVPIGWQELQEIMKKNLPKDCRILLFDEKYRLPDLKEVKEYLKKDKTDEMEYIPDYQDCDTFARRLWGAFAMPGWGDTPLTFSFSSVHAYNSITDKWGDTPLTFSFSSVHAYNSITDKTKTYYLIEPQADRVFRGEDYTKIAKEIIAKEGVKPKFPSRRIFTKASTIAGKIKAPPHSPNFYEIFDRELKKHGLKEEFQQLQEIQHKVRIAVHTASKMTKGKPLKTYVQTLFEELKKKNIEDQLEEIYQTICTAT